MTTADRKLIEQWAAKAWNGWERYDAGDLVSEFIDNRDGLIPRWACNDDKCPARPDWDRAMSAEFDALCAALDTELERAARKVMVRRLTAFLAAHPETPINAEAVSDAAPEVPTNA